MEKVLLAVAVLGIAALAVTHDHYKAVRHELYQVWDSIGEMRAEK